MRLRRRRFFSYKPLNACLLANVSTGPGFKSGHGDPSFKKREKFLPTSYVTEEYKIPRRVFLSYESLNSRKRRTFYTTTYLQGQLKYGKPKEAVESAKASLLLLGESVRKSGKEKKRKRPRKARRWLQQRQRSVCPKRRIHFF